MKSAGSGARQRALAFALTLAAVAGAPSAARAQPDHGVEEGRTRFGRGIELYKEGNFHAALAEFRAAYAAAPSYRIHYNLGQTLFQIQDYAGAVRAFEQYLLDGADKIDADRRAEVESDLAKLRPRVARLNIVVNVPSAEIVIDDEPRGKVQKQALLVSGGRRRVSVTASGYQTETRVLDVAGAQQLELKFELKPLPGAAVVAPEENHAPTPSVVMVPKSRTPFYVGLVTTVVLAGGTTVMALVASKNHSDYERALDVPNDPKAIRDARSATKTTALVADVFGGATVLAAGLTALAFALTSGTEPASATASTVPPKATVRPSFGLTSVGVLGTF